MNQRSISRIHFEYTISFVNFRWIHYLFREFTLTSLFTSRMYLNPLFLSRIHYKFAFLFKFTIYFADWIRIGFFGEETMNSLLVSRIIYELSLFFCEFTINSIFFTNPHWINYHSRKLTMNILSISPIHLESTFFREITMNSLSFSRNQYKFTICFEISQWIHCLFREFTIFSRNRYEFTIHYLFR